MTRLELVRAEKARRNLKEFVLQAWHVLEPETPFVDGVHVDAICSHLQAVIEGRIQNLGINVPPGSAKSLLTAVFFPAWAWIDHPALRWLFASYSERLSTRDSVKCRQLIKSDWYQLRWGHRFQLTDDGDEKTRFINNRTGYRISTSVNGTGTGERCDILVVDDPHSVKKAESDQERQSAVDWFFGTMSSRLNDLRTGHKIVVQQRLHESDVTGELLKRKAKYDFLILPAEYDPEIARTTSIGWHDPRTIPGELLWPNKVGPEEIAAIKTDLGSYKYAGQYGQRPSPADGGMIKRTWWKFWSTFPTGTDLFMLSMDASFRGGPGADYVVIQCWAKKSADYYLIDQDRGQWNFPDTIKHFLDMTGKWPQASLKLIELKANGQAILDSLRQKVSGMVGVTPHESKESRMAAVSPLIEAGNVWLPSNAPWVDGFIEEHAQFPNGSNDDQCDGTSQALYRMSRKQPSKRESLLPR